MAIGKLELKSRIRLIESTKKITKAMQLVSASKLKKQKSFMEEYKIYVYYMRGMVDKILSSMNEKHKYTTKANGVVYTIVFTSDMGLCGGYNTSIYRLLKDLEGELVVIGSRGNDWCKLHHKQVVKSYINMADDTVYNQLSRLISDILKRYDKQEISEIRILYTQFVNAVTFEPRLETILPLQTCNQIHKDCKETIYEPSQEEILEPLVLMYLRSILYNYYLESKTSEQASRRMAMETATNSAQELVEELELFFHKARQAEITQEITEIVGGVMEGGN